MAKVVAFVGAKGGTLKTASVAAVSHALAGTGVHVAMVDLDPQGDLTTRSGFSRVQDPLTAEAKEVRFNNEPPIPLWLLRGGRSLESANYGTARAQITRALELDTDLIVLDTPPALGPLTFAAAHVADYIFIPSEPGLESLTRAADVIRLADHEGRKPVIRILLTKVDRQTNLFKWMIDQVDEAYPGLRSEIVIPHETAAAQSAIFRVPTTVSAPRSNSAFAYVEMAVDILRHLNIESRTLRQVATP